MINQSTCEKPDCDCCKGAETCPNDKCKCDKEICKKGCETAAETAETAEHIGNINFFSFNFDDWISDMEEGEQPQACTIDNPDCENCGS